MQSAFSSQWEGFRCKSAVCFCLVSCPFSFADELEEHKDYSIKRHRQGKDCGQTKSNGTISVGLALIDRNTALHIKLLRRSTRLKNQRPYNDLNIAESRLLSFFFNDPKIDFSVSGVQYILRFSFALVIAV